MKEISLVNNSTEENCMEIAQNFKGNISEKIVISEESMS